MIWAFRHSSIESNLDNIPQRHLRLLSDLVISTPIASTRKAPNALAATASSYPPRAYTMPFVDQA